MELEPLRLGDRIQGAIMTPFYHPDDTTPFTWRPQLFQLIEIHSELEALRAEWKGLRVTKSSILASTWYVWVRIEEKQ
jgi:hypothetical protein